MLSVTWRKLPEVRRVIREVRARTELPFGVNLVLAWEQDERLDACLEEGVRIFSFFWGTRRATSTGSIRRAGM
jgi:nitronate monooxygenase